MKQIFILVLLVLLLIGCGFGDNNRVGQDNFKYKVITIEGYRILIIWHDWKYGLAAVKLDEK